MGRPARILLYSDAPSTGGAEAYLDAIADAAGADGYRVDVAIADTEATRPWGERLADAGHRVHRLARVTTLRHPGPAARHAAFFARRRYALVHFNQVDPWSCAPAIVAAHATGHRRLIATSHLPNTTYDVPTPWRARVAPRYLRRIVLIAHCHLAGLVTRGEDVSRHRVVVNGIDVPPLPTPADRRRARETLGIGDDRFVLGAVGRLTAQKNHVWLVRALASVPGATAFVIGDGPEHDALATAIERRDLRDRVRLLGARDDVAALLPGFDAFAMPSRYEGMPFAALEALAAALPIVATDAPEFRDVGGDTDAVSYVPLDDDDALAAAIGALVDAPDARRRRGATGRARVEAAFRRERMLAETLAIYREVAA